MKLKPVIDGLELRGADVQLVHTGQHYDTMMSDVFFEELGLRRPDCHLNVGSGSHAVQTAGIMLAFEPVVNRIRPDIVVVVGDVNSTLACALVSAKAHVPVAHVEAGLRSRDRSMPEEINRVVVDRLSNVLLAPSPDAVENLLDEGIPNKSIQLVGNVMIDSLLANIDRARRRPIIGELGLRPGEYGLVTMHRPANVDDLPRLQNILKALHRIADDCPLVFPAHPRTHPKLASTDSHRRFLVIPPVGYLDSIALQAGARLVLTDSGGVQEETTVLGVACLTLRENTERPITVSEGTNEVVGHDPERILRSAQRILRDGVVARRPALWDGRAGLRSAQAILRR